MSIQKQLFTNLKTTLENDLLVSNGGWARSVEFEKIRMLTADFELHDLPAIQIYDIGESAVNQIQLTENTLAFSVEIVMTRTTGELVDQGLLFDRKLEVKRSIGKDPRLGITSSPSIGGMQHVQYVGSVTDFATIKPHYLARLDFQAIFTEPFVRDC